MYILQRNVQLYLNDKILIGQHYAFDILAANFIFGAKIFLWCLNEIFVYNAK